jgi:hypothetical protein
MVWIISMDRHYMFLVAPEMHPTASGIGPKQKPRLSVR